VVECKIKNRLTQRPLQHQVVSLVAERSGKFAGNRSASLAACAKSASVLYQENPLTRSERCKEISRCEGVVRAAAQGHPNQIHRRGAWVFQLNKLVVRRRICYSNWRRRGMKVDFGHE